MAGYCEVALPVPLRRTFTYGIPDALDDLVVPGAPGPGPFSKSRRSSAWFSNASAIRRHRPRSPSSAKRVLKHVTEVLDPLVALPDHVLELGRWVAGYYLAPIGETFRAMLPPAVELRVAREWQITCLGHAYLLELQSLSNRSATEVDDLALLATLRDTGRARARRIAAQASGRARRVRAPSQARPAYHAGSRPASPDAHPKNRRVACRLDRRPPKSGAGPAPAATAHSAEARVERVLAEERGPLPLPQLLASARVSRTVIERLAARGQSASLGRARRHPRQSSRSRLLAARQHI